MNPPPVAGTFRLDGMLQASLGGDAMAAEQVEKWAAAASKQGLPINLQFEGSGFSILGVSEVRRTSALAGADLEDLIIDGLQALVDQLPGSGSKGVMSTIRSEEFRPGEVVQTLYSVNPAGKVVSEQRTLDIETEAAPPELNPASIRRYAIYGIIALLVSLGISSLFIDYRKLFSEARDQVVPLSKEEVALDTKQLGKIVTVKVLGVDNRKNALILELQRGPDWESAMQSKPSDTTDWQVFMARQAVHSGRLRVELYNKKGERLREGEISLAGLHRARKAEVAVVARLEDRLARVVVRP